MLNVRKTKKEIAQLHKVGRRKMNAVVEKNYIKLEKGYYSLRELFLYTFKRIFGDRASEIFKD